jgi:hypothetical protein
MSVVDTADRFYIRSVPLLFDMMCVTDEASSLQVISRMWNGGERKKRKSYLHVVCISLLP